MLEPVGRTTLCGAAHAKKMKRDGNIPTRSGQAPVTEGRTQRTQRKGKKERKGLRRGSRRRAEKERKSRSLHPGEAHGAHKPRYAARSATNRRGRGNRATPAGMTTLRSAANTETMKRDPRAQTGVSVPQKGGEEEGTRAARLPDQVGVDARRALQKKEKMLRERLVGAREWQ